MKRTIMKKNLLPLALALLAGSALGWGGRTPMSDLEARVNRLEAEVAELRLSEAKTREELGATSAYLQAQAKAAGAMIKVLEASVEAGFTAGINFGSREILVAGLSSYWTSQQKDVPGKPAKDRAELDRR